MQDLGAININIREMGRVGGAGGASGGGGSVGGGPRIPIPSGGGGGSSPTPPRAPAAGQTASSNTMAMLQKFFGGVETGSAIKSEALGFITSPSASGLAGMLSSSGATGGTIAALGAAAAPLVIVAGGLLVVGAALYATWKMLGKASEIVLRRLEDIGRFSGAITAAQAGEYIAKFNRDLREAAVNGLAFARVQREATLAADAQSAVTLEINKLLAPMAILYQKIVKTLYQALLPMAKFIGMLGEAAMNLDRMTEQAFGSGLFDLIATGVVSVIKGALIGLMGPTGTAIAAFGSEILEGIKQILMWLGLISANTKPATTMGVNDWFLADVQAITRRSYGGIGDGRKPNP